MTLFILVTMATVSMTTTVAARNSMGPLVSIPGESKVVLLLDLDWTVHKTHRRTTENSDVNTSPSDAINDVIKNNTKRSVTDGDIKSDEDSDVNTSKPDEGNKEEDVFENGSVKHDVNNDLKRGENGSEENNYSGNNTGINSTLVHDDIGDLKNDVNSTQQTGDVKQGIDGDVKGAVKDDVSRVVPVLLAVVNTVEKICKQANTSLG
ncbi:hypothetical protein ACOMHN_065927 [Nucella lapillus]